MRASIQLLLGFCMYSFLPKKNSMPPELLENINVVNKKLTQSKNGAVPFGFKIKLESSSAKRSVLGEILLYFTAVYYRVELLSASFVKCFNKTAYFGRLRVY